MQRVLSDSESSAISLLRVISMCGIVVCHLLQGYDNPYCYLFNIGVQVFLAISGYLYGCKTIHSWRPWFIARLKKLYIPYLVFFLVCIPFYYCYACNEINPVKIILYIFDLQGVAGSGGVIKGLSHLWFMSAIAICYLFVPILQYFRNFSFSLPLLFIVAALELFFIRFAEWQFSWLLVFALGYFYASDCKRCRMMIALLMTILFLCSLVFVSWNDILQNGFWNLLLHVSGGVLAVIITTTLSKWFSFSFGKRILKVVDKYSYEVYITHHIFILGPFSMLFLLACPFANILFIILWTILTALVLRRVSSWLTHILWDDRAVKNA